MRALLLLVLIGCPALKSARPDADGDGYDADIDCDDAQASVSPAAVEVCDGLDNNCNGATDDAAADAVIRYLDVDGDGYGSASTEARACPEEAGYVDNAEDCDDADIAASPAGSEACNGKDDDCDGETDEGGSATVVYPDLDGDGFGDLNGAKSACSAGTGEVETGGDCDDTDADIKPGAYDGCDTLDNDCDGSTDEDQPPVTWYFDGDDDGWGDPSPTQSACSQPEGWVTATGDCDDDDDSVSPSAPEVCDGLDQDCDGLIDNGAVGALTTWPDLDSDGYGDSAASPLVICELTAGYVENDDDCDDLDPAVSPLGLETCDGVDQDCDGLIDDDALDAGPVFVDADGDGYGDGASGALGCTGGGYATEDGDCDDADPAINPGATEVCNGDDDDCDGVIDTDAIDAVDWYVDADRDGYGGGSARAGCTPGITEVSQGGDCDDTNLDIHPGASEVCDTQDNNCDGLTDDDDPTTSGFTAWYLDADGDAYGVGAPRLACAAAPGETALDGDCDDSNSNVSPGRAEVCDSADLDEDCDGVADDADGSVADALTSYPDLDGDGHGDPAGIVVSCDRPSGYVGDNLDCDDTNVAVYGGRTESCDGLDSDCDSSTLDDGLVSRGGSNYSSIQAAIDSAASGDTIEICAGTWYENLEVSGSLQIVGHDAAVLDGAGRESALWVGSGTVSVQDLTIQNGDGTDYDGDLNTEGGNVLVTGGSLSLNNVVITGGYARYGGGIAVVNGGSATMTGGQLNTNEAIYGGGAFVAAYGMSLTDTVVIGNSADSGGGISVASGVALSLDGVSIQANTAASYGGGLTTGTYNDLTLLNADFSDNTAGLAGGAISTSYPELLSITGGNFTYNTAPYGGAMSVDEPLIMDVSGVIFSNNVASQYGGALYLAGTETELDTSAFVENQAFEGGAIFLESSSLLILTYNEFVSNIATNSGGALVLGNSSLFSDISGIYDGNYATYYGGAIDVTDGAYVELTSSEFSANQAVNGGALFLERSSEVYGNNSAFYGNVATGSGGASYGRANTILSLEIAELGGGAYADNTPQDVYGEWYGGYSWVGVNTIFCHLSC